MRRGIMSFVGTARQLRSALRLLVALQAQKHHKCCPDVAPKLSASALDLYIKALRRYGMVQLLSRDRAMHLASMAALVLDGKVSMDSFWRVRYEPRGR